jgi:HSP20 family protein
MKIPQPSALAFALALATTGAYAGDCPQNGNSPDKSAAATPTAPVPAQFFYYNPWADLMRMQAMMDHEFNAMNLMPAMFVPSPAYLPAVQASTLQRTSDGYRLDIPLPGYEAKDIKVRLDGEQLTISAETSHNGTTKVGQGNEQTMSSGSFAETLTLPGPVEASALKESFEKGVLSITIPARKAAGGPV